MLKKLSSHVFSWSLLLSSLVGVASNAPLLSWQEDNPSLLGTGYSSFGQKLLQNCLQRPEKIEIMPHSEKDGEISDTPIDLKQLQKDLGIDWKDANGSLKAFEEIASLPSSFKDDINTITYIQRVRVIFGDSNYKLADEKIQSRDPKDILSGTALDDFINHTEQFTALCGDSYVSTQHHAASLYLLVGVRLSNANTIQGQVAFEILRTLIRNVVSIPELIALTSDWVSKFEPDFGWKFSHAQSKITIDYQIYTPGKIPDDTADQFMRKGSCDVNARFPSLSCSTIEKNMTALIKNFKAGLDLKPHPGVLSASAFETGYEAKKYSALFDSAIIDKMVSPKTREVRLELAKNLVAAKYTLSEITRLQQDTDKIAVIYNAFKPILIAAAKIARTNIDSLTQAGKQCFSDKSCLKQAQKILDDLKKNPENRINPNALALPKHFIIIERTGNKQNIVQSKLFVADTAIASTWQARADASKDDKTEIFYGIRTDRSPTDQNQESSDATPEYYQLKVMYNQNQPDRIWMYETPAFLDPEKQTLQVQLIKNGTSLQAPANTTYNGARITPPANPAKVYQYQGTVSGHGNNWIGYLNMPPAARVRNRK